MLESIIGQQKVKQILTNQFANKKIPHAYLFIGQEGIGKKFCAIEIAKILNCNGSVASVASASCGLCNPCLKISKNIHPDIHFIDFEKQDQLEEKDDSESEPNQAKKTRRTLGIKIIRHLQTEVLKKSQEAKWKVFIIDPADKITPEGSNALLKTLEEPPANTILILIARQKETIPQTISSRCQTIFFQPLKQDEIINFLIARHGVDKDDALKLAILSEGSISTALNLMKENDEKVFEIWDQIRTRQLKSMPTFDLLNLSKSISKDKAFQYIDIMIAQAKLDFRISPHKTAPILELFNNAKTLLLKNVNTQTVLDVLFLDLASI